MVTRAESVRLAGSQPFAFGVPNLSAVTVGGVLSILMLNVCVAELPARSRAIIGTLNTPSAVNVWCSDGASTSPEPVPSDASISIAPNSRSIGTLRTGPSKYRSKFFRAIIA